MIKGLAKKILVQRRERREKVGGFSFERKSESREKKENGKEKREEGVVY